MVVEHGGRLGVDIGGTFTDVALEAGGRRYSAKILTTPDAPERAVLEGLHAVLREAALAPADLSIIIHGTTLATNAIIERKGAKTALLTTEGFRDTIEIRHENRFEQYDVNIDLPPPLVPRRLRFPVRERIDAGGRVLVPLDEAAVSSLADRLAVERIESVAIGFLHSFTNPAHERRTGEILGARLPEIAITLVERRLARDARVRALLDGLRQCLCPAADQPLSGRSRNDAAPRGLCLSAVFDAVGRRADRGRNSNPLSGAAC